MQTPQRLASTKAIGTHSLPLYDSPATPRRKGVGMKLLSFCSFIVVSSIGASSQTVVTNPSGSQNIVQSSNTSFSANNYAGTRYVTPSYNWSQSPSSPSSLSGGVQAT